VQHFIRLGGSTPELLSKVPTLGMSLSMTNLRSAITSSYGCPCTPKATIHDCLAQFGKASLNAFIHSL
jgi:hypothetical protein